MWMPKNVAVLNTGAGQVPTDWTPPGLNEAQLAQVRSAHAPQYELKPTVGRQRLTVMISGRGLSKWETLTVWLMVDLYKLTNALALACSLS